MYFCLENVIYTIHFSTTYIICRKYKWRGERKNESSERAMERNSKLREQAICEGKNIFSAIDFHRERDITQGRLEKDNEGNFESFSDLPTWSGRPDI